MINDIPIPNRHHTHRGTSNRVYARASWRRALARKREAMVLTASLASSSGLPGTTVLYRYESKVILCTYWSLHSSTKASRAGLDR